MCKKKEIFFKSIHHSRNTLFYIETYCEDICQCYATNLFLDNFKIYCDDKRNITRNYSCLTKKVNPPNYRKGMKNKIFSAPIKNKLIIISVVCVLKVLLRLYVDLLKFLAKTIDDVARSFTEKRCDPYFNVKRWMLISR